MSDALIFLARREYANNVTRRLRRLREPRYLLALAVAVVYLFFLLPRGGPAAAPAALPQTQLIEPLLALAAGALVLWGWLFADRRTPLEFTPAELNWLFPAPLPRRTLILYKLARWQLPLLFNSLLLTFLFSADRSPGVAARRVLAVWVVLATLRLHRLAASLVRSRWFEPDTGGRMRSPALVPAVAWVAALAYAASDAVAALDLGTAVAQFVAHPVARGALLPLVLLVRPIFVTDQALLWLAMMAVAVGLLLLHLRWVIAADAAFTRAATRAAARGEVSEIDLREDRRVRPATGRLLVQLRPVGPAWLALPWKQLAPVLRRDRVMRSSLAALVALALMFSLRRFGTGELPTLLSAVLTVLVGALGVAGPQLVRLDLRRELQRWELLRTLPLSGRQVLLGLGAATFAAVMALQFLGLLLLWALDAGTAADWPGGTESWLLRLVLILPPLNALGSVMALAGAVLFPAWSAPVGRRGGLDALGTNLLALVAYVGAVALLAVVPLAAGAGICGMQRDCMQLLSWRSTPAMTAIWAVTVAEVALLLGWLGRRFDRTDGAATGLR